MMDLRKILKEIKWNSSGLIPAVVQDYKTGEVLMLAYMNRLALKKTIETGLAHFYSRSRKKLWMKGETSGHVQKVKEIRIDCDADAVVLKAAQKTAACHTGYWSCFYRTIKNGKIITKGTKKFIPEKVYKRSKIS
ncbi:MAG TPA: phosphoribosyl-AMP cyclohydrolase [bacterium]